MSGRTLPTVGNLVITEGATSVEIRLRTFHAGVPVAVFTYGEIALLIETLKSLRQPSVDDIEDMLA